MITLLFVFIKNNYLKILGTVIVIALLITIWFKGIHISTINNNTNQQYQVQSQVAMNLFLSNGRMEWRYKKIGNTIDAFCKEKSKLPPEQACFATRETEVKYLFLYTYYLVWPEFKNN